MVSLFIYIWHIRKAEAAIHCLGWLTEFWLETTFTTARLPQAQLCIWFRCQLLLQRMVPLLPRVGSSSTGRWMSQRQQLHPFGSPSQAAQGTLLPSPHQAELNPDLHSRSQSGSCSLSSCVLPRMLSCPQPEEGWYPHQYTQFSHMSHLSSFPSAWHWKAL